MIRKSMPSDLIRGWVPVFPRDKREAFARRSCSNKKIERDDDSKKSHPALAETHAPQSRQFDRRPAQIDAEHRAEKVDLDTFDPADRQAQIATEGDAGARSRRRRSEHVAIV